MTRVSWDDLGSHTYERGIDRGVLYVDGFDPAPWNGLTSVSEKPSGGSFTSYYMDGEKYWQDLSAEDYEATLSALTYPDAFDVCEGIVQVNQGMFFTSQVRRSFGLTYRTFVGNDLTNSVGYKIHIVYNAQVAPTQRGYASDTDTVNPVAFSWDIQAVPVVQFPNYRGTAHVIIDTQFANAQAVSDIEDFLYGNDSNPPALPDISDLDDIINAYDDIPVIDNGDGTYTIGPSSRVSEIDVNTYDVDAPSVVQIDIPGHAFRVSSS